MFHLGRSQTTANEWRRASATYGRLSCDPNPRIVRSARDFPSRVFEYPSSSGNNVTEPCRVLRRSLCDLGHVNRRCEMGKLTNFIKSLAKRFIKT